MITLLFRMYGQGNPEEFMKNMRLQLSDFELRFIMATNVGDPLGELAKDAGAQVIESNLSAFDEPVNALRTAAREFGDYSLFVSPGVGIGNQHLATAISACEREGYLCYSWQLEGQFNDGSGPGRFGYNTCWLDSPTALSLHPTLPEFVNNGVLNDLSIVVEGEVHSGKCGGGEETVAMIGILQADPTARFCHNVSDILPMPAKTGTNVTFDWKIARKGPVAEEYTRQLGFDANILVQAITIV